MDFIKRDLGEHLKGKVIEVLNRFTCSLCCFSNVKVSQRQTGTQNALIAQDASEFQAYQADLKNLGLCSKQEKKTVWEKSHIF